jgi:TolB-like protein/Flp pilus assembly protein TadD
VILSVTEPSHAVFLSYASQDAEAAQKVGEALRAAGIEVFLDQSELRGGDVWDQKIRREIHDCALFIPVISANTASRHEGYFRLEWDLADQRTHMIARSRVFVVPVCLDTTTAVAADVPESFRRVQWTRLPGGETPPAFVERIKRLLSPQLSALSAVSGAARAISEPVRARRSPTPVVIVVVVVFVALAFLVAGRSWVFRHPGTSAGNTASRATAEPGATAAFDPPPHSIAVLPFVNLSGDASQEYFSDGMTEELLNSLARIREIQVAGRTSSFYFKGKDVDLTTIAHKLNVAAVLEGSVRRSQHTVRVTAQLINAITGFHLWSETYDRNQDDVLKLQTEIANAVTSALKVTLLGDVAAKVELGGTRNPAAFDAYLRGWRFFSALRVQDFPRATAAYTEAVGLDPNYALAFAHRSMALSEYAESTTGAGVRESFDKAQQDAREAIALTPELAEGHLALALYFEEGALDFARAAEEFERAVALDPGNARVLRNYGVFASFMGRTAAGIAASRRAVTLDPLNPASHHQLGMVLYYARQYDEAIAAFQDTLTLRPEDQRSHALRGLAYYAAGNFAAAHTSCELSGDYYLIWMCLAVTYEKLGRHADSEAVLAKLQAAQGDAEAYQYATIYAQWGNRMQALEWLDTAMRLRDPGLELLKTDPLLDPLRREPRFKAIERELKFPD